MDVPEGTGSGRLRLDLAYDGTDFAGWQRQPGRDTIQQRIEHALGRLYRTSAEDPPSVVAAGRTDRGVHAEGQVAHFDAPFEIPPQGVLAAANRVLPPAIRIRAVREVPPNFHARYHAVSKTYRYHLAPDGIPSPLVSRFAWATGRGLDLGAAREAAAAFRGRHDFRAFFTATGDEAPADPVRTITGARLLQEKSVIVFEVTAPGFLRYMVRRMVGTLEAVGRGQLPPSRIREMLDDPDSAGPRFRAPAAGLRLHEVRYPETLKA